MCVSIYMCVYIYIYIYVYIYIHIYWASKSHYAERRIVKHQTNMLHTNDTRTLHISNSVPQLTAVCCGQLAPPHKASPCTQFPRQRYVAVSWPLLTKHHPAPNFPIKTRSLFYCYRPNFSHQHIYHSPTTNTFQFPYNRVIIYCYSDGLPAAITGIILKMKKFLIA